MKSTLKQLRLNVSGGKARNTNIYQLEARKVIEMLRQEICTLHLVHRNDVLGNVSFSKVERLLRKSRIRGRDGHFFKE